MLNIIIRELSSNGWDVGLVYKLLQKLRVTGLVDCRSDSGR